MNDYKVYRLDSVGGIAPVELINAADDDDAVRQARQLGRDALKCEVWQGRRLVIFLDSHQLVQGHEP